MPSDEEIAAIVAAIRFRDANQRDEPIEQRRRACASWGLAGRYPDLEFDDLRAVVKSGRVF